MNNSPPHQRRRKQLKWRCAAALVRPSGSHHGARRTSVVYSTAACLDHHRCQLQSIAMPVFSHKCNAHDFVIATFNASHLVADIRSSKHAQHGAKLSPFHGTAMPGCAAANLEPVFGRDKTQKNHKHQTGCKLQNTSRHWKN